MDWRKAAGAKLDVIRLVYLDPFDEFCLDLFDEFCLNLFDKFSLDSFDGLV